MQQIQALQQPWEKTKDRNIRWFFRWLQSMRGQLGTKKLSGEW